MPKVCNGLTGSALFLMSPSHATGECSSVQTSGRRSLRGVRCPQSRTRESGGKLQDGQETSRLGPLLSGCPLSTSSFPPSLLSTTAQCGVGSQAAAVETSRSGKSAAQIHWFSLKPTSLLTKRKGTKSLPACTVCELLLFSFKELEPHVPNWHRPMGFKGGEIPNRVGALAGCPGKWKCLSGGSSPKTPKPRSH